MINTREVASEYRLAHWAQVMRERTESGLSIKDFCKQIGICGNTYFYWQRRVRAAACEALAKNETGKQSLAQPSFAEVMVVEPPTPLLQPVETTSQIRIEIGSVQIVTDSAYPADKLTALLRGLRC